MRRAPLRVAVLPVESGRHASVASPERGWADGALGSLDAILGGAAPWSGAGEDLRTAKSRQLSPGARGMAGDSAERSRIRALCLVHFEFAAAQAAARAGRLTARSTAPPLA